MIFNLFFFKAYITHVSQTLYIKKPNASTVIEEVLRLINIDNYWYKKDAILNKEFAMKTINTVAFSYYIKLDIIQLMIYMFIFIKYLDTYICMNKYSIELYHVCIMTLIL